MRKALLTLDWGPADERERDQKVLERLVRERVADLPGARLSFISNEPGEKMQLVLAGDDPQRLGIAAEALERDLRTLPGLGSIQSSAIGASTPPTDAAILACSTVLARRCPRRWCSTAISRSCSTGCA